MQRLCGRPGCSEGASVAYGMRAEDLVFWIDVLPDPLADSAGVLCLRHADSMVVPRGWTLDDLRDPDLHLFRPPPSAPTQRPRTPRVQREPGVAEQLRLDASVDPSPSVATDSNGENGHQAVDTELDADTGADTDTDADAELDADADADYGVGSDVESVVESGPWTPEFDEADDLDGLLDARGPLLSRAFRTADRPAE